MYITAARLSDLEDLASRAVDQRTLHNHRPRRHSIVMRNDEGTALASFTALIQWPGVACLEGYVVPEAAEHPIQFARACQSLLQGFVAEAQLRRLSAWVHADLTQCQRFARLMGFREEHRDFEASPDGGDLLLYIWRRV